MAENEDKEKIEIAKEGLEKILNNAVNHIEEIRALALDRYRRQDELINGAQDFILQGKNEAFPLAG